MHGAVRLRNAEDERLHQYQLLHRRHVQHLLK